MFQGQKIKSLVYITNTNSENFTRLKAVLQFNSLLSSTYDGRWVSELKWKIFPPVYRGTQKKVLFFHSS